MLGCGAKSFGIITVAPFFSLYVDIYTFIVVCLITFLIKSNMPEDQKSIY